MGCFLHRMAMGADPKWGLLALQRVPQGLAVSGPARPSAGGTARQPRSGGPPASTSARARCPIGWPPCWRPSETRVPSPAPCPNISPGWPCPWAWWWAIVGGARDGAHQKLGGGAPLLGLLGLAVALSADHAFHPPHPGPAPRPQPPLDPYPLRCPITPP